MPYEISTEATFSAAHYLSGYPGDCARLHGHNWKVRLIARADERKELGLTFDFRKLREILKELLKSLDHSVLNDLEQFKNDNPTAEAIAEWIYHQASKSFSGGVKISRVEVWESQTNCATYLGE